MSRRRGVFAFTFACLAIMCLAAVPFAAGQLTIVNPQNVEVPEQTAQILLRMSCKVAAEQFHVTGETEFPLILILGDANEEHYSADDANRVYAVYLKQWSESRFTSATTMIAVRRLALPVQSKMVSEILKRTRAIIPVQVKQLSTEKTQPGQ